MTYGTIKVDTVTFTDAGVDKSVTLSGLVQNPTFSGNVTVTGTLSGVTVTGTTANFTSGNFTNISGGTHTITSGVFAAGSAASPSITFTGDLNTGIYSPGADQVAISTGGSGRLFVDASGRVGVGTSTPQHLLDCVSIGRFTGNTNSAASGAGIEIGYDSGNTTGFIQSYNRGSSTYLSTAVDGSDVRLKTSSTERARIDSSGRLLVGTSSARSNFFNTSASAALQVEGASGDTRRLSIVSSATGNAPAVLILGRQTSGSIGGNTSVANDSSVGWISFQGNDGAEFVEAASIECYADGTPGANDMPGRLVFSTTADGASSPTERLRITSAGLVGIGTSSPQSAVDVLSGVRGVPETSGSTTSVTTLRIRGSSNGVLDIGELSSATAGSYWLQVRDRTDLGFAYNLALQPNGGNVGIGTTSPGYPLDLVGDFRSNGALANSASNYIYSYGGGINGQVRSGFYLDGSNNVLAFFTAQAERARIDSSGRFGIGTSSPQVNLDVRGTINAGNGTTRYALLYTDTDGAVLGTAGLNHPWIFKVGNGTSDVERARIDTSGRLLVGTSSYSGDGTIVARGSSAGAATQSFLILQRGQTNPAPDLDLGVIRFTDAAGSLGAQIAAQCDGGFSWGTNDYPTRLVFSTTADGESSPTERMRISQNGTVTINGPGGGTFLNLSNSGGYSGFHEVDNTAYTIGQNSDLRAMRIGSGANWLTTGVNLAPGGTSWGTYSDERLKTDIVELTDCLNDIKGIRCVSYRLTDVDNANSKKRIGVIAQDLVGKYDEAINASRRSENDETEYLSVQYSDLIPVLLKALQEASVKIESLESRLTAAGI